MSIFGRKNNQIESLSKESPENLEAMFNGISDSIFLLDPNGIILQANSISYSLFGKKAGKIIGKHCHEVVHGTNCNIAGCPFIKMQQSKKKEQMLLPVNDKWFEVTVNPILDKENNIKAAVHVISDITERKKNEEELRFQSELLTNMDQAFYLITMKDNKIVYANPKFEEMFGYEPGEMIGNNVSIVNAPGDLTSEERARQIIKSINQHRFWKGEVRNIKKNGVVFWCFAQVRVFNHSTFGKVCISVHTDITEQKRLEEVISESEKNFRFIAEKANDLIYVFRFSPFKGFKYVSPSSYEITGYKPGEFYNDPFIFTKLVHPDDQTFFKNYLENKIITNPLVLRWKTKNGDTIWIEQQNSVIQNNEGAIISIQSITRDITERKNAEEELEKSHEILMQAEQLGKVGGWEFNMDTQQQTWTEEVFRIHELDSPEQPTVEEGIKFYTSASRPIIEQAVQRAIEMGEPFDLELEITTAKGNHRYVNAIGEADLRNRKVRGFFQDITERKQTEIELHESRTQLLNAFNYSPLMMSISELYSGKFLEVNDSYCAISGYSREELVGKTTIDLGWVTETERKQSIEALEKIGRISGSEYYLKTKSGKTVITRYTSYILDTSEGKKLISAAEDITQMRNAEIALKESEELYRSLFENMSGFAYCKMLFEDGKANDFIYLKVNKAFESQFRMKDVSGKRITELVPTILKSNPELFEVYGRVALSGKPESFEIFSQSVNNWFSISVSSPARDYILAVIESITERKEKELEIRQSKTKFQNIFENSLAAIYTFNNKKEFIDTNPAGVELLGYSKQELLKLKIDDVDAIRKVTLPAHDELLSGGNIRNFEHQLIRKDGKIITVLNNSISLKDDAGNVVGMQSFLVDITQRKLAEAALRESRSQLLSAFNNSPVMMSISDLSTGKFLDANYSFCTVSEFSKEELLGKTSIEIGWVSEENRKKMAAALQKNGRVSNLELDVKTKSGKIITCSYSGDIIVTPEGNKLFSTAENITERKKTEEALFASEEIFRNFMEHSPVYVFFKDENIRIQKLSKNYETMFGKPIQELIGKSMEELFPSELAKSMDEDDRHILKEGKVLNIDEELNGRYYSTIKFPINVKGNRPFLAGFTIDVTERKLAEFEREQFNTFFSISPDIMVISDPDGCFRKINPATTALLGYSEEELLSKPFIEFVHPDDVQETHQEIERQIATGSTLNFLNRYQCKDGSVKWLSWRANFNKKDGLTYATARDISDIKLADDILRNAEGQYKELIETIEAGIVVADYETKQFIFVNPAICLLFGYSEVEFTNKSVMDIHPKENMPHVLSEFEALARGEKVLASNLPCLRKDGSVFYANVRTVKTAFNGKGSLIGIFTEVQ